MIGFSYLAIILLSFVGMGIIDYRYKLAGAKNLRGTIAVVLVAVVFFVLWDILGIVLGIFFSGESKYMSGIYLAPDFPVEELFFLAFLSYFTLVTYLFLEQRWPRT